MKNKIQKKQKQKFLNIELDEEIKRTLKARVAILGITIPNYIERLIILDCEKDFPNIKNKLRDLGDGKASLS